MVEFHVLCCVQCQIFQVLQVTKTTKWKCKMCGLKQSVTKVYGQGSGADCRRHVQKLNSIRGQITLTAEEQHLMSASQKPVTSGVISTEKVTFGQQETVAGSRWSSFLDESHDELEEPLQDDVDNNGSVVATTTDWAEYQRTSNSGRKRRAERNFEAVFSKLPGNKSKIFHEDICKPDSPVAKCDHVEDLEPSTDSSVNKTFSSTSSSGNLFSSKPCAAHRLSVSSSVIGEYLGSSLSSIKPKPDCISFLDPSNDAHNETWRSAGLSKTMSVNGCAAKKGRQNESNTKVNCKLTQITANSKWDTFLETEHNSDEDDTVCDYNDNVDTITDSKLHNSHSLTVGKECLMQKKQFVNNIQKHPSVHCSHESKVQSKLNNRSSDWLKESKHCDWLKESNKHIYWLKEIKNSDYLKKCQPCDWLTDSEVKRTHSNSMHSANTNSSSSWKGRGTFDLDLEILDEDLLL